MEAYGKTLDEIPMGKPLWKRMGESVTLSQAAEIFPPEEHPVETPRETLGKYLGEPFWPLFHFFIHFHYLF